MRSVPVRRMAVLTAVLGALAAPGHALAQGAGDEQYSDPFAGSGSGGGTQTQSQGSGSTSQAPSASSAPATTTSSSSSSAAAPAAARATPAAPASELPRTGLDLRVVASAGVVLLLAGLALWRRRPADDGR